jgi:membrane dipeptidase
MPLLLATLLAPLAVAADVQADLHLDTPTQIVRKGVGLDGAGLEAGLAELRAGGTTLAVMVLWPPQKADWEAHVETLLARMEHEDARLDAVQLARTPADARALADAGKVAIVYGLEGAHGIDKSGLAGLGRLHDRGLAILGLTWSFSNRFAGSSGDGGGGLTADGRALVAEANRLGVLLDLSHASKATTLDTCHLSTAPVIASHSDAALVQANPRNLSDEEIACIAATGGVIGVNLHSTFLGSPPDAAKAADHLDHLRKVGGIGVVALGSDFDGLIKPPPDIPTAGKLGALWAELRKRGWTDADVRAVRGENFLRAWAAAQAAAAPAVTTSATPPASTPR